MTSSGRLNGKVALVTGGARRVGRAIALALADAGMDVAITYHRSRREAAETVAAIRRRGRRGWAIGVNLARTNADEVVHRRFICAFDRLDALVNNASDFQPTPLGRISTRNFDQHMAVNVRTPLMLIQKFAPMLGKHYRANDPSSLGRVVNFIDIHVMGEPLKGYMAYNASKAALMEVTMTMAREMAPRVTVNAIAPGVVAWAESYTPAMKRNYLKRVPLARPGTPDDAASAALFLIRDADYCTGQIIKLDGGRGIT